jgi:hypothetical protein
VRAVKIVLAVVAALGVASQTAPGDKLRENVSELRERQYLAGVRIACEARALEALTSGTDEAVAAAERTCARVRRPAPGAEQVATSAVTLSAP